MLKSITITNFRCFPRYHMPGLARVNLLVGRNNSGKTALLEAVHAFVGGGDPRMLEMAAERRREMVPQPGGGRPLADLRHVFPDRSFDKDSIVEFVGVDELGAKQFTRIGFEPAPARDWYLSPDDAAAGRFPLFPLRWESTLPARRFARYALTDLGLLISAARVGNGKPAFGTDLPFLFVDEQLYSPRYIQLEWSDVLIKQREGVVFDILRKLDARIIDVVLDQSEFLVRLKGAEARVPIGSLGYGTRRLLELAICMANCANGYLMVDEIGIGLHYTILPKVWEFLIRAAIQQNTQVFASTHSKDCLEALGAVCDSFPELASEVALHRISSERESSIPVEGAMIEATFEHHVELRS